MPKKITLKSSDNKTFVVEEAVALQSQTIKHLIEDDFADDVIPLANVTGRILAKVIEYCKKHAKAASDNANKDSEAIDDRLKTWDDNFVKVDLETLYDVILAANYLGIESLLDLTCQTVADIIIKAKTPEEIRKTLDIESDFTPEEEEQARRAAQWAFQ